LDQRRRALGEVVESLEQRAREAVERSRELPALSGQRLSRHEAAVGRAQAHRERQQAELSRLVADSKREHAAALPDPSKAIARAKALREEGIAAMEALASKEDEIARINDELAASSPERREGYRRIAEQARTSARKARAVASSLTG
jgi:hypothetical protein